MDDVRGDFLGILDNLNIKNMNSLTHRQYNLPVLYLVIEIN